MQTKLNGNHHEQQSKQMAKVDSLQLCFENNNFSDKHTHINVSEDFLVVYAPTCLYAATCLCTIYRYGR